MNVVYDTNTYISGIFWKGLPRELLLKASAKEVDLFISTEILEEIQRVLKRDFEADESRVKSIVDNIIETAEVINVNQKIDVIKADPSDNKILACALECRAKYIVSGDYHLLSLKEYKGIKILKATEFLEKIKRY